MFLFTNSAGDYEFRKKDLKDELNSDLPAEGLREKCVTRKGKVFYQKKKCI